MTERLGQSAPTPWVGKAESCPGAGLMLTTEAMIAELPKKEKAPMPGAGMDDY
jgi:hypothetical protein